MSEINDRGAKTKPKRTQFEANSNPIGIDSGDAGRVLRRPTTMGS